MEKNVGSEMEASYVGVELVGLQGSYLSADGDTWEYVGRCRDISA